MRWPIVLAVLGGCEWCSSHRYTGGVTFRSGPANVPMNQAWEQVLEIYSGGTWGPVAPHHVSTSTDPAACRAIVAPQIKDGDDMRLIVIGARVGHCTVDVEYLDPHEKPWKAKVEIDFTPAETLPTLAVGKSFTTPAMWGDARCDLDGTKIRCFPKDVYGADERHASCKWSSRCSSSRGGPQGFELCVSKGIVTEVSDGGCAP